MSRRAQVVSPLVLFLLWTLPGWSQRKPAGAEPAPRLYSIRGNVRFAANERVAEMIKVDLKRFTGEVVMTNFTRSNGEFEFSGLSNGVYILVVEEPGYEPVRENVEISNTSRAGILLYLKKPSQPSPSEPGHFVSVRELTLPQKARTAFQRGMDQLYEKKDIQGSLAHFQRAISELPTYYEAYHYMGVAYLDLGRTDEAEQAFRKSIELSQNRYADPHFALGALLSTRQSFTEAEAVVRRGLELDTNSWQGHYELARALFGLNRVPEAERSAHEARTRKIDFAPLYLLLANIHIRKRDYPTLLNDLDEFLKLDPGGPMSNQARQMRQTLQRALANAHNASAGDKPKP